MKNIWRGIVIGTALVAAAGISRPAPAVASTAGDIAVAAGAIVGALLIDANNHPYYVRDNHRYYVTQDEANYYRAHHHVVQRAAWVPENEYDVRRNAGYRIDSQRQVSNRYDNHNHDDRY